MTPSAFGARRRRPGTFANELAYPAPLPIQPLLECRDSRSKQAVGDVTGVREDDRFMVTLRGRSLEVPEVALDNRSIELDALCALRDERVAAKRFSQAVKRLPERRA